MLFNIIEANRDMEIHKKNRSQRTKVLEAMALSGLTEAPKEPKLWSPTCGDWIRMVRTSLRMSQADLAKRSGVSQPHLAGIETGKVDPRVSTLRRIFEALSCDLVIEPQPTRPLDQVLRDKARSIARKRLRQSMGTMALENQAPNAEVFKALLEQRTDEILSRKGERIWRDDD